MSRLQQQQEVLNELGKIETLIVEDLVDGIRLIPSYPNAYSVQIRRNPSDSSHPYSVLCSPGLWEGHFDSEDEALDLFFSCLTEEVRLAIASRRDEDFLWQLELRQPDGAWAPYSTVRRKMMLPWGKTSMRYLSNPYLRPPA